jgi:hypothetical protein
MKDSRNDSGSNGRSRSSGGFGMRKGFNGFKTMNDPVNPSREDTQLAAVTQPFSSC